MKALGDYVSGRAGAPSRRELNSLIERYEWFTTARRARALVTGEADPALALPSMFRATVPPTATTADRAPVDLIDRFIERGSYRIIPSDEACEVEVDIDVDPGMVTEELAEIYRSQGLTEKADEIYRTLNLRNS